MLSAEIAQRLAQAARNRETEIEWDLNQFYSPIGSKEWYRAQLVHQFQEVKWHWFYGLEFCLFFIVLLPILAISYFIPNKWQFFVNNPPKNQRVRANIPAKIFEIYENNQLVQTIEIQKPFSIFEERRNPFLFSDKNQYIKLKVSDKTTKIFDLFNMETATVFSTSDPEILENMTLFFNYLAESYQLSIYREFSNHTVVK